MFVDMLTGDTIELSLFVRAVAYAVFFIAAGVFAVRADEDFSWQIRALGWFSILVGIINIYMAAAWVYLAMTTA